MAQINPGEIAEAVAKQLPAYFNDTVNQVKLGEALYLRDGVPEGVVARIGQAVGRSACRNFGASPTLLNAPGGERFERACRPYLDSLTPGRGLGLSQPFSGGQQAGRRYRAEGPVTTNNVSCFNGAASSSTVAVNNQNSLLIGPLSVRTEFAGGSCQGGRGQMSLFVDTPSGNSILLAQVGSTQQTTFGWVSFGGGLRFVPFDGLPDGGGSPPPTVRQPSPTPNPQPPPFRFNPVPAIDINIDTQVNPDGTITFDIGTGDITVDPFPPDSDTPDSGPGPGEIGSPALPSDTGDGDEAEGEAPEGSVIGALKINILGTPPRPNTFSEGVFRGACYVRMGTEVGLDLDPAGAVLSDGQLVLPEKDNLTHWKVVSNVGYNLRVTPYYLEVEE